MEFRLEGVIPALLTPFTAGGAEVDCDKLRGLVSHLVSQGVHGVFPCGTTGEGMLMSVDERKKVIEEVVAEAAGRITVIAHTGSFDTATTIALTRHAQEVGAAAAGIVTPGFYGYDNAALTAHFKAIAAAVPGFPILLYNIPGCARNHLSPDLVVTLARDVDSIVGMKDSSGNMGALSTILANKPADFTVINGVDEYSFQALVAGAKGSVSSTANVIPEVFLSIFNHVKSGNLAAAWESQVTLCKACHLFQYGAMVAYYKEGLRLRGLDAGFVRGPQRELTQQEKSAFAKAIEAAGLFA